MTAIWSEAAPGLCRTGARRSAGARLVATIGAWRRRARERAELARLDSRLLADIGLSRAEAEFIINKPFWRS
jgi:uncharacterized protein YjiS (DUF1127 family)